MNKRVLSFLVALVLTIVLAGAPIAGIICSSVEAKAVKEAATIVGNGYTGFYDGKEKTFAGVAVIRDDFDITQECEDKGYIAYEMCASDTYVDIDDRTYEKATKADLKIKDAGYLFIKVTVSLPEENPVSRDFTMFIEKRPVSVTTGSAVTTYSSAPSTGVTNSKCVVSGLGFVEGEMADGYPKANGTLDKPATEPSLDVDGLNTIEYSWAGNGKESNYEITENEGLLEIVADIYASQVIATNYSGVYDGKNIPVFYSTSIVDPDKVEFSIDDGAYTTDVPEIKNVKLNPQTGETESYMISMKVTKGQAIAMDCFTVTITRRELNVFAYSSVKPYDGTSLGGDYIVDSNGFANSTEKTDAAITISSNSSQKDVGCTENQVDEITSNGSFITSNYSIIYRNGKLYVTKRHVTLTSEDATKAYDGTPLTKAKVTVGEAGFAGEEGVTYDFTGSQTIVGKSDNIFSFSNIAGTNLSNYMIETKYGELSVTPKTYQMLEGNNQSIYVGANSASFKSEAPFDEFEELLVDDEAVDPENYDKEEGSTIITLNKDYIATLSAGTHTLSIVSTNGQADCSFNIATIPNTGDVDYAGLWIALISMTTACAVVVMVGKLSKKRG